jgi:hypothetical protein
VILDYTTLYFAATSNGFDPTHAQIESVLRTLRSFVAGSVFVESNGDLTTWPRGNPRLIDNGRLVASPWSDMLRTHLTDRLGAFS